MPIRFPKVLHNIYKFHFEGKCYVADLDCGQTIEVSEVLWALLDLCADHSIHGLLEQLRLKYKEERIFAAIEELESHAKSGLIVSAQYLPERLQEKEKARLKLFVPYDFIEHRARLDASTQLNQYQLLLALAKKADIYIPISSHDSGLDIDFGQEGIHTFAVDPDKLYAPTRFVMEDCDGVLLLSQHPQSELVFFRHTEVPVVCRIESDCKTQASLSEFVINSSAVLRDGDALCVSASWLKDSLNVLLPDSDRLFIIPSGADLESFTPEDKASAKKTAVKMFRDERLLQHPVVGLFSGIEPRIAAQIAFRLALANPHLIFLVLDPVLENLLLEMPDNLYIFGVRSFQERKFLPVIFNALDVFCFATMPATSASLVLEAMACGIPPIVISKGEKLPAEVGDAGILVKARGNRLDELWVDIETLSREIHRLLTDKVEYSRQEQAVRTAAGNHTWERAARCTLELFQTLKQKRKVARWIAPESFPFVFIPYYERGKGELTVRTFDLTSHSYRSTEEGLAWSLFSQEHTIGEIEMVLQHVCRDSEQVELILAQLREYR